MFYVYERLSDARISDLRRDAERIRIGRETVKAGERQRARLDIRQPVGIALSRLGDRITGSSTGRPALQDATGA